jgi:hypothetical protein
VWAVRFRSVWASASSLILSVSWSASMLSRLSCVSALSSLLACPLTHCTFVDIYLHHSSCRLWNVFSRSQSLSVLWYMLLVSFWLHRLTAASLSHTCRTDLMLMRPDRAKTPITAIPAQMPPSSYLYDVMYNGAPSSGPPPCNNMCSSFVETSQLLIIFRKRCLI